MRHKKVLRYVAVTTKDDRGLYPVSDLLGRRDCAYGATRDDAHNIAVFFNRHLSGGSVGGSPDFG